MSSGCSSTSPGAPPAEGSFHIEQEISLAVPRARAWQALLDVNAWWCHHFASRGPRLHLEAFAGGRFYEDSADGTQALFGTVTYIRAPEIIRLSGPLGMNRLPVVSVYEWRLDDVPGEPGGAASTALRLSHRAMGILDPEWRNAHQRGWEALWAHLKAFAEHNRRYQHAG